MSPLKLFPQAQFCNLTVSNSISFVDSFILFSGVHLFIDLFHFHLFVCSDESHTVDSSLFQLEVVPVESPATLNPSWKRSCPCQSGEYTAPGSLSLCEGSRVHSTGDATVSISMMARAHSTKIPMTCAGDSVQRNGTVFTSRSVVSLYSGFCPVFFTFFTPLSLAPFTIPLVIVTSAALDDQSRCR